MTTNHLRLNELSGRVALVTGASRGIGRAIALALSQAGAAVAVNYRERAADADAVAELVRNGGGRAATFRADVSFATEVGTMIDAVREHLGPVDILVNNAGMAAPRTIDDITEADFDATIAANLKSAFLCTQMVLPHMREQRWGRIINVSSIGARIGSGSVSVAYGAAKAGLEGLTRAYALRIAADGVTVNAVAPGLVDTDMGKPLIEAGVAGRIPVGRAGTGDEVAQAVLLLARDAYITGQTIAINGGSLFL
jgi:3-oxoacyl-[acyl-carrier protein] reductase